MGPHGPWLLILPYDDTLHIEQVPLAPLRWENLSVSVDGLEDVEDVGDRLLIEARICVRKLQETDAAPDALGLRVRLTGASPEHNNIKQRVANGEWNDLRSDVDGTTTVFFNKIIDAMALGWDLEETAKGEDPAALLAQRLLILENDKEQSRELLEKARDELSRVADAVDWVPVQEHRNATDPLSDDALRELLVRSGKSALNTMLSRNTQGNAS